MKKKVKKCFCQVLFCLKTYTLFTGSRFLMTTSVGSDSTRRDTWPTVTCTLTDRVELEGSAGKTLVSFQQPSVWIWFYDQKPGNKFLFEFFSPDDAFDVDRTGGEGEEEEEDEDNVMDPVEIQRRRERLEREQWLREQVGGAVGTTAY